MINNVYSFDFTRHRVPGSIQAALAVSLLAYISQIVLPSFNDDDIIQGQSASNDSLTFLSQGRWGYYLIYRILFDTNPTGPFALACGIIVILAAATISARTIGLQREESKLIFILFGTVSVYYSYMFSFDSTRVAYPLAVLLVSAGIYLLQTRLWSVAVILLAVACSINQASVQVAVTLIVASTILPAFNTEIKRGLVSAGRATGGLLAAAVLYVLSTRISVEFSGVQLTERAQIDVLGALSDIDRVGKLLKGHALPNGGQMYYFTSGMSAALYVLMALFWVSIWRQTVRFGLPRLALASILFIALLCAPFALAFFTPLDEFSPRALIAYAFVHATIAGICIERFGDSRNTPLHATSIAACSIYLITSAVQINSAAFDEYLVSRNDILATNRIIYRIDEVISGGSEVSPLGPIPIVVVYETPYSTAPRGPGGTYRASPWSREWIFRHVDPRFHPVMGTPREPFSVLAKSRPTWPKPGSIFVANGTIVVHIN